MARRLVDLSRIIEELRAKNHDAQGCLTTLSKIEIAAIAVQEITASKIRQFLQYLPVNGYYFNFVQKNVAYYLLSHATLGRSVDPLGLTGELISELEKYVQRNAEVSAYELLNNAKVLEQLKAFTAELRKIQDSFDTNQFLKATLDKKKASKKDLSDHGTRYLIRSVLSQVNQAVVDVRPLINCRLVAELVDHLYRATTTWFRETLQYTSFIKDTDTDLDAILKMVYFYANHRRANAALDAAFAELATEGRQRFRLFTVPGLDGDQQAGAEYIRETSFKLFSASLTDKDSSGLVFPMISTELSVLNSMSVQNLFFHPGLVYRLLNGAISPHNLGDRLDLTLNFLNGTVASLFLRSTVSTKSSGLRELSEQITRLTELGLNYDTSRLYAQMCLTRQSPDKHALTQRIADYLREIGTQICQIVYNAYLFFLCLNVYSPTFLFNQRRRILLEQQRSLLVGSRSDLDAVWSNVTGNVNYYFTAWFTEDEFDVCVKGATAIEREYLYRDLLNKWGDILFTLRNRHPDPAPLEQSTQKITVADIISQCAMVNLSNTSYESLLPLSSHASFVEKFVNLVIVPELTQVLNVPYAQFRTVGAPRLLQIIQACRLLMPGQMTLYHKLVALYNLTNYVSKIDGGVFRVIYNLTLEITAILEGLCKESLTLNVDLIAELMAESLSNNLRDNVDPIIDEAIRGSAPVIQQYLEHTRLCYAIAMSHGKLVTVDSRAAVAIVLQSKTLLTMPLPDLLTAIKYLLQRDQALNDSLVQAQLRTERIWRRVSQVVDDMSCAGQCSQAHPIYTDIMKSLKKTQKTLKAVEQKFSNAIEQSQKSNRIVASSLNRIVKTCSVLSNENIAEHGLQYCITEAVGTIKLHQAYTAVPASARAEPPSNTADLLQKFFQPYVTTPTPQRTALDMSSTTDVSNEMEYLDVFGNQYTPLQDLDKLLNWYVSPKAQAQEDICAPLRPATAKCASSAT
ncbi:tegument protein UL37 [Aotine betaherpesvirus 1]|uniref:Tegument protein UL37 n=1 Tax=Aotine betaherpesvirus 1 TaxID=50290 RepID=G8XUC2_9BETA|nr:tegument protein UL37 [Aotine betaherpesvirus 1]AEV80752.1 tegument protein UL37 [Aotine betaherpesvirus 1]